MQTPQTAPNSYQTNTYYTSVLWVMWYVNGTNEVLIQSIMSYDDDSPIDWWDVSSVAAKGGIVGGANGFLANGWSMLLWSDKTVAFSAAVSGNLLGYGANQLEFNDTKTAPENTCSEFE